jgi:hypothetical protein
MPVMPVMPVIALEPQCMYTTSREEPPPFSPSPPFELDGAMSLILEEGPHLTF